MSPFCRTLPDSCGAHAGHCRTLPAHASASASGQQSPGALPPGCSKHLKSHHFLSGQAPFRQFPGPPANLLAEFSAGWHCTGVISLAALFGLFVSAFLAGSILPAQSELVLAGMARAGVAPLPWLLLVATLGNVAGAMVNYALGAGAARWRGRRWFPLSAAGWARAEGWWRQWGRATLLLSWLPVVGDGFTVLAGAARTPWPWFLALVTLAKGGRYLLLVAVLG